MNELGYIVCDKKLKDLKGFVKCVDDFSLANLTKPTLLVGIENAKKNIKTFSILNKKIGNHLFWTYKKTENRVDFEKDINYFYKFIINNIIHDIKYYYINIYNLKYNKIKKLYNIIYYLYKKYIYISNNIIYIIYNKNNKFDIYIKII